MKPKRTFPRNSIDQKGPPQKKRRSENLWAFDAEQAASFVDYDDLYSPVLNDMKHSKSPDSLCTKITEASCPWDIVRLFVGRRVFEEIKATAFGLRLKKLADELQYQHKVNFKNVCSEIRKKFPKYKDNVVDLSCFRITQGQLEQSLYQIFNDLLHPVWGSFSTKKDTKVVVQSFAHSMIQWCDGEVFMKDRYYEDMPLIWDQLAKVAMDAHLDDETQQYSILASATAINVTRFVFLYSLHVLRKLTSLVFVNGVSIFIEKTASKSAMNSGKFADMFHNPLNVKKEISTASAQVGSAAPACNAESSKHAPDTEISASTPKAVHEKITQRVVTKVIEEISVSSDDEVSSPKIAALTNKLPAANSFDPARIKKEAVTAACSPAYLYVKQECNRSPSISKSENQNLDVASSASSAAGIGLYPEFPAFDIDVMDDEMKKQILTDPSIPATTKGLIISLMDQKKDLKSKYNQLLDSYMSLRSHLV